MSTMKYRTTFSLDAEAVRRLRALSAYWHVSQAEVIRRALERAEAEAKKEAMDPYELLAGYHADGNMTAEVAEMYLKEVYEDREDWRG